MKKYSILSLMCVALGAGALWGGAIVSEFRGEPGRNKVTLKWTAEAEINLKGYEVERGLDDKNFEKLDFVKAKGQTVGQTEYTYEDNSVFKATNRVYYYRLKIVDSDDSFTLTKVIEVNPTISSARATWGSIKAMFR